MFGGFAPLPLRLGGDELHGWDASQHARLCADITAAKKTAPLYRITIFRDNVANAEPQIVAAHGQPPGDLGIVLTGNYPDPIIVTFPTAPDDEFGDMLPLRISSAKFTRHNVTGEQYAVYVSPTSLNVPIFDAGAEIAGTITVYGQWGDAPAIQRYGGITTKEDSKTEAIPYAWIWYQELSSSFGSAYGRSLTGLLHARKIAWARGMCAVSRADECARNNAIPGLATFALKSWANCLQTPFFESEESWKTRERCAAIWASARDGSLLSLEAAVFALIGDNYLGIRVIDESGTWPSSYDLGGGVWASSRCRILIDVRRPFDLYDLEYRDLIENKVMHLADMMTPSFVGIDWTSNDTDGFRIGISPIGFAGIRT